jgi:C-terminal processing protease CtpA/Prc
LLLGAGWFLFIPSCSKEKEVITIYEPEPGEPDVPGDNDRIPEKTLQVNEFIKDYMQDAYLWTSTVQWNAVDPKKESDSFKFFDGLIYTEDKWSSLTDDIEEMASEFEGVSTTFGYRLIFGHFSNANALFVIVLYVYPGSPADEAGIKRGDIFVSMNGGDITEDNYMDLYYAPDLILGKGVLTDRGITTDPEQIQMSARSMYENPVIKDTVIVKGVHKIGYLSYTDYTIESEQELIRIFSRFKAQGVSDVVLDLRYNGGGYARTSLLLSSILAPASAVEGKDLFLSEIWNDAYMAYFKEKKINRNEYFMNTVSVNMDLSRVFILTSGNTASASEATIVGLDPYMYVVRLGKTTHGKYCGGVMLSDDENKEISNWGMYLMVYRFANKNGITSFTGGLEPDVEVEEDYFDLQPFGDERDPLLGTALGIITGNPYVQTRSGKPLPPPYTLKELKQPGALDGKLIQTKPVPRLER